MQQRGHIVFVHGKGKHKSEEQRRWEELDALCKRWEGYEDSLKIMGKTRNSYSKTDPDATFMRMKDDHMRNGQLKPAYNVQIAVNSEYITGVDVFSNRTDFGTLVPFLKQLQHHHEAKYKEVTADAEYESLDNYLFLEENGQVSFIKPANYEAQKTKKFKQKIGRVENMTYDEEEDCFTCAEGSNAQRSTPYATHTTSVQQQRSIPYTDVPTSIATAGHSQPISYVDAFRQMQAAQERAADLEYARYKELERKFVDGSINEQEWNELVRLENVWGKISVLSNNRINGEHESDFLLSMERKARAMLTANKAVVFSALPYKMKVEFEGKLASADPDVEAVLRKMYGSTKYKLSAGPRSYYTFVNHEDATGASDDTITLGIKAQSSTIARELFHRLDKGRKISTKLADSLTQDFVALNVQGDGDVKAYIIKRYPNAFHKSILGFTAMKLEYRGIADILNGLSGETVQYGFGHDEEYWAKEGNLEAEAWAQYGRVFYENNREVIAMFEEVFPSFAKKARESLGGLK